MRAHFVAEIASPLAPDELWRRLWDLSRHSDHVPLTTVRSQDGGRLGRASSFTARTRLGPLHLDDVMLVSSWEPPREAVVVKTGRLLTGTIHARVRPTPTGSLLRWEQEFGARGVPDRLAALLRIPVGAAYERTLRRIIG